MDKVTQKADSESHLIKEIKLKVFNGFRVRQILR